MIADFSQPQRQSKTGIVIMFVYALQQYARAFWPLILISIFKFDKIGTLGLVAGIVVCLALLAVVAYFRYMNFTFHLDDSNDEFIISEGIFTKSKTAIQLNKIQQVNINQSLLQRVIGVYSVDVDTAGSNKKEGKISAVSHEIAIALKAKLLESDKTLNFVADVAEPQENILQSDKPFIVISFLSLLKVGITSNYLKTTGLLLAFFLTMFENLKNVTGYVDVDQDQIDNYFDRGFAMRSILFVILIGAVLILIINIIRVIFRYFNYKITKQNGSLLLSYGLIDTKSTILKPERVQITSVTSNYFQKKMDIVALKIKQASSGEKEDRKSALEIPGCSASERDAILKLLFDAIPQKGAMLKPNYRKLVFSLFLSIVVPVAIFFLLQRQIAELSEVIYFVPLYVVFVGLVVYFGYRNNRLFIHDRFIIRQSGAWDIENEIIEPSKIQAISTSQLFWHKSPNIGSLTLHTAGGDLSFQLGNFTTIKAHANRWLYEIETSDSNWM